MNKLRFFDKNKVICIYGKDYKPKEFIPIPKRGEYVMINSASYLVINVAYDFGWEEENEGGSLYMIDVVVEPSAYPHYPCFGYEKENDYD